MQHYDLIVVGGGLVGVSLALALRDAGWKMAIIDAKPAQTHDPRLYGLNYSSCEFLKNLQLWPTLAPHATPIYAVEVSQRGLFGAVRLSHQDIQVDALGHVIPAAQIEVAMEQAMQKIGHVDFYRPATLISLKDTPEHAHLTILQQNAEIELTSRLVIGADGTHSTVRSLLGLSSTVTDYQQTAIVTRTQLQRPHQGIAYERFTQDGAIAMLPLMGKEYATIWTTSTARATQLLTISADQFVAELQTQFGYRLGKLAKIAERFTYPLQKVDVPTIHKGRIYLLGNAAHTLHPIAAQGLNLAIYETAILAEILLTNASPGSIDWDSLNQQLQRQKSLSTRLSHYLARFFSSPSRVVSAFLQAGMVGLDVSMLMKRKFINQVLGRNGYLPRLLQNGMTYDKTIPPDD